MVFNTISDVLGVSLKAHFGKKKKKYLLMLCMPFQFRDQTFHFSNFVHLFILCIWLILCVRCIKPFSFSFMWNLHE